MDYYSLYDYKFEDDWMKDQLEEESYREEKRPQIGAKPTESLKK